MTAEQHNLVRELRGTACRCGNVKHSMQTFCAGCYYKLPGEMRRALYRRMGDGYEDAYSAAAKRLFPEKSPE